MAIFSQAEALACTVLQADKESSGSTFVQWSFKVVDDKKNVYSWESSTEHLGYASTPTAQQVANYCRDYLYGGNIGEDVANGQYAGVSKIGTKKLSRVLKSFESVVGNKTAGTPSDIIRSMEVQTGVNYTQSTASASPITFANGDATPSVGNGNMFNTHTGTLTITMFDDGDFGQLIHVFSKGAITYDVTGTNLKGGSVDLVTASGDVTSWLYDGSQWQLINFMDVSANLTGGH